MGSCAEHAARFWAKWTDAPNEAALLATTAVLEERLAGGPCRRCLPFAACRLPPATTAAACRRWPGACQQPIHPPTPAPQAAQAATARGRCRPRCCAPLPRPAAPPPAGSTARRARSSRSRPCAASWPRSASRGTCGRRGRWRARCGTPPPCSSSTSCCSRCRSPWVRARPAWPALGPHTAARAPPTDRVAALARPCSAARVPRFPQAGTTPLPGACPPPRPAAFYVQCDCRGRPAQGLPPEASEGASADVGFVFTGGRAAAGEGPLAAGAPSPARLRGAERRPAQHSGPPVEVSDAAPPWPPAPTSTPPPHRLRPARSLRGLRHLLRAGHRPQLPDRLLRGRPAAARGVLAAAHRVSGGAPPGGRVARGGRTRDWQLAHAWPCVPSCSSRPLPPSFNNRAPPLRPRHPCHLSGTAAGGTPPRTC